MVVDVDDLEVAAVLRRAPAQCGDDLADQRRDVVLLVEHRDDDGKEGRVHRSILRGGTSESGRGAQPFEHAVEGVQRSEEHTSELQSLMRISYAVFCL